MSETETSPIRTHRDGAIGILTIDRPARMNALTPRAGLALKRELTALLDDDAVRIVVLTGEGGHFCTGADLKDRTPGPNGERLLGVLHDVFALMVESRKPLVAAVEGNAYGAGFSLAVACDYVVAAENAKFCAPFTGIGLVPDVGLALTLPARIGMGRARRMMIEGLAVQAPQALDWGMIEHTAPVGEALPAAVECARKLLTRAPLAVAALRRLLGQQWQDPHAFLREERRLQDSLQQSSDFVEGVRSFVEKRPAQFTGK
ncbi:enoyl-CoA hydratase/isomerase family protein [Achromobacter sp. GG226]|uniref:enoyl-CoA hydratase/isomerase family protein n=1 Tax=Verticiella alkaliphila TaxID=2779529 RepID=UPI001C0D8D06|nr:enoyl-CoA hydratase/isomerase family protein [Verticiella sp. GG226]MBU4610159.1 enoyl-CoA hydratase/isomerase family protein [Verticiella sp. GG226]